MLFASATLIGANALRAAVPDVCDSGCTYTSIQAAVNAANPGDTITVGPGTYHEDVNVNKQVTLQGAGIDQSISGGVIGGDGATVRFSAAGVVVDGFTITRDGNNTTDWDNPNLNSAGVAVQGLTVNGEVRNSRLYGNRTGVDINNSNGNTLRNNIIDDNRTGIILRNQTDNTTVVENFITNNWTVGILFLDASGGTNSPVQTAANSTFSNNNISGNWYGGIVDRQSGGSLPAPGTTNLKNFSANWLGTTTPVVTTSNTTEPGYSAQIPVAYGGTATPPGGAPDIAGTASGNVDFTPLLGTGTDTNVETTSGRGTVGFQGDYSNLIVHNDGAQTGTTGRIQEGVNLAKTGGTVNVPAGNWHEDVNVNKQLRLQGAGIDQTTLFGVVGGDGATVRIGAAGVIVDGFTITRDGNNTTDWDNPNLNSAGVAVQGQTVNVELRNSRLYGNRTGVDINNSNGNTLRNNIIDDNRTGIILRNQTDNTTVVENFITNNWTVGILFLDASGGTNSPVQTAANSTFSNNNISGNWYGGIVDRQSGGSLPAPGTTNLKNFSANWLGTTTPVVTTSNTTEPGYSAQIPVAYGGTATPPGGAPDIAGTASGNVDFTPLLGTGTDTNVETTSGRGTVGFQGDYSNLIVHNDGAQTGTTGRIQEGVNLAKTGGSVNVVAGTYPVATPVQIDKALSLRGPNFGISPNHPTTPTNVNPARVGEATIAVAGANQGILIGAPNVTIDGFRFTDPGTAGASNTTIIGAGGNFGGAAPGVAVTNNLFNNITRIAVYFNGPTSMDGGTVDDNRVASPTRATGCGSDPLASGACGHQLFNLWQTDHLSFQRNVVLASPANGDRVRVLNVNFPNGPSLQSDAPATNIMISGNTVRFACTFTCFTIAAGATNVVVENNDIEIDTGNAVQLHPTWTTGTVTIRKNILNDPDFAVVIDNASADLDGVTVTRNSLTGKGVRNASSDEANATCNWWGSASGPTAGQNTGPVDTAPWLQSSDLDSACTGGRSAVLVVGTPNLAPDNAVANRLTSLGFIVTVMPENDIDTAEAGEADVVVLSTSVNLAQVTNKFKNTPAPLLTFEGYLHDENALSTTAGAETSGTFTQVAITNPSHPLAAGLSGNVAVSTTAKKLSIGKPTASADIIATVPGNANQPVLFGYEAGDLRSDGSPAPAGRVGFFWSYGTPSSSTSNGWNLFDAAITWLTGPTSNQAPIVNAGPDQTITAPDDDAALDGTVTDDGKPVPPTLTVEWTQVSGPAGVVFGDPNAVDTTATFPGEGTYVLRLTADDRELTGSDEVEVIVKPAGGGNEAVLVVGVPGNAPDNAVANRLTGLGYNVTVMPESALDLTAAGNADIVVLSTSVNLAQVSNKFKNTPAPLLTFEGYLHDENALSTTAGSETSGTFTQVAITNPAHPLAAGLSGTVAVSASAKKLSVGKPTASADIIATVPGNPNQPVLFGYETGDLRSDSTAAPAARVGFFWTYGTPTSSTTNGWKLFDASVAWVTTH